MTVSPARSETSMFDPLASTENLVLITQLKDEVESLKKQLALKEQQLLEKDKNVSLRERAGVRGLGAEGGGGG